ncbi:MAG: sugar MFS transporter [Acidobacteria bacterium]|nr:sugar MFS transporter [Acidobacteriota bacterium]MBS1865967.1 sugar MFS transporter [Acidobacteriota bacterium]
MPNVNVPSSTPPKAQSVNQTYVAALSMVTVLFFFWGFITSLNDILIPHFKAIFDLNYTRVMLIQFAFFFAYFIFSMPSAKIVDTLGYKKTMVVGLVVMALGAFVFLPAASLPSYPLFLAALMVVAGGITALQVSANAYVAILGPPETASSRLNLAQAFNSFGTTIGPYLGGIYILSSQPKTADAIKQMSADALHTYRIHEASSVKMPYVIIGLALLLFAVIIGMFKLPPMPQAERHGKKGESIWKYTHLVLGAVGIFVYVGAEVSIGSFLINYFAQPDIGNLSQVAASKYVSYYWGGAMVGRFVGSAILQRVKTGTLLGIAATAAVLLVCTSMLTTGPVAMWSIILVGFFNSIMFPSIFTLGIAKLGPLTGDGSGLLIMAIVGGAIIPVAQGWIADHIGVHHAFLLPVLCYAYIVYYGLRGSRPVIPSEA